MMNNNVIKNNTNGCSVNKINCIMLSFVDEAKTDMEYNCRECRYYQVSK